MLVELLCEAIFFYPGFKITQRWKRNNVGGEYFKLREGETENESVGDGDK